MTKRSMAAAFAIGLTALLWVGWGFVGTHALALAMTVVIGGVYLAGAWELTRFRRASAGLAAALAKPPQPPANLGDWLQAVPASLRGVVRGRIEGERVALPGPALAPYLAGLLVMLGMLGTFLGMVVTFKGAVFALEGSTDLQAVRSALAEPIRGLGLAFGTSVAGVAASAMLGLMSALCRRERLQLARELDQRIATDLRPYSLVHQRQETYRALQAQAQSLPAVVDRLDALMTRLEERSQLLDDRLAERQSHFHQDVTVAYTRLADSVGASLRDSLAAGARAAGDSITPVVETAMARIEASSRQLQAGLADTAAAQASQLAERFAGSAREVSAQWSAALQAHARTSDELAASLRQSLAGFTERAHDLGQALLAEIAAQGARAQAEQAGAEQQRLQALAQSMQDLQAELVRQWQLASEQAAGRQQALTCALEQTATEVAEHAGAQAARSIEQAAQLLRDTGELVRARSEAEARWTLEQARRMDELTVSWDRQWTALRHDEAERGQAAVARLDALQAAVAGHLANLGTALEAPLNRLLQTASEVPQAAADVIVRLREEMGRVAERDNLALQERNQLLQRLDALLQSVEQASGGQRAATEALLASASAVLEQAGERFTQTLQAQGAQSAEASAHLAAGALELGSLGEAFNHGVALFQSANDKLLENLQRIEGSLTRSTARSDEQLAYYVAQAREVIDLSIASQQGLVENLRKLQAQPVALLEGDPA
ncbi:DUF802 domain-containing protein [Ramlibacter sp. AW1]|uniref:DUF802 domain-containing protein n=1 Tax=Ramlibacter aurantiacus TaxID=2801330 RepID=A0A937D991_9BURK|nr:DUF802 domain-containing protein [Ramlibacter aurantiacus]MBL0422901.1 DUF802 domain-containing protein [Ramlibacter aurantiacus]